MLVTITTVPRLFPSRFIILLSFLLTCTVMLLSQSFMCLANNTARAQQQQEQVTSQGTPITIIPGLTQNVLTIVSFLIGTSSFILGLRIQNATRATTESTSSPTPTPTLPLSIMNKYFELLILALVIPSIIINIYGILLVGSHLYPGDAPYLLLLFALFIPAGAVLLLVRKLSLASLKGI
jgi:hypothetical protein